MYSMKLTNKTSENKNNKILRKKNYRMLRNKRWKKAKKPQQKRKHWNSYKKNWLKLKLNKIYCNNRYNSDRNNNQHESHLRPLVYWLMLLNKKYSEQLRSLLKNRHKHPLWNKIYRNNKYNSNRNNNQHESHLRLLVYWLMLLNKKYSEQLRALLNNRHKHPLWI